MKKIIGLIMVLMMFGFSYAALSVTNVAASKESFKPGESGTITLTVTNADTAYSVDAVSITVYGYPEFAYKETINVGDMNPGTSTVVSIPIKVADNAESGVYVFDLRLQGSVTTGTQTNLNYKSSSVAVSVLRNPVLTVSGYPPVYHENGEFPIIINNYGGAAKNVKINVLSPFALYGTNEMFLSEINGTNNAALNLTLNVVGVDEGQNTLGLEFTYDDELGNEINEVTNISLAVKKEQTDLVFSQASDILSKTDSSVKFKIVNGGKTLNDVKLQFDSSAGFIVKSGDEIKIGDVASGETTYVVFPAYVDASPGTRNVNATITYFEDGKEKSESIRIATAISSASDVQVLLDAKPLPVIRGQEETLSITVANTWDYPVESTSVRIDGDFYTLVSVQNEQYIGLLNKDDFSSVQFKVLVKSDAPAQGNLTAYIRYKDPTGAWVEKTKLIPVKIGDQPAAENNTLLYAIVIVVLVAAVYWLFFRKKK